MKLIQNRFCRRRYKIQTKVKKWLGKKKTKKSASFSLKIAIGFDDTIVRSYFQWGA